jgi:predicted metal-dependent phosphoesterase TrpH
MNTMKFDFHIHSKYSFDSLTDPKSLIKKASFNGYGAIAITDHDFYNPQFPNLMKRAQEYNLLLIPGEEISFPHGEIIALFINEFIERGPLDRVLNDIYNQDGIAIFAHPFKRTSNIKIIEDISKIIDFCELNGRESHLNNKKVELLCRSNNIKIIASSDSHYLAEFGNFYSIAEQNVKNLDDFRNNFKNIKWNIGGIESQKYHHLISSIIGTIRTKKINHLVNRVFPLK